MKRQFNVLSPAVSEDYDEAEAVEKAQALASVASRDFLDLIRDVRGAFDEAGGRLFLAANRRKVDAEGKVIPTGWENGKRKRESTPGRWETYSLSATYTDPADNAQEVELPSEPVASGLAVAALAYAADARFLEAVLAMKVALDYFGGQVHIVAHREAIDEEETTVGYIFHFDHRDQKHVVSEIPALVPPEEPVEEPSGPVAFEPKDEKEEKEAVEA